jgi:hypothetical protein
MGIHERMPMMRFGSTLLTVLTLSCLAFPSAPRAETTVTPHLDLRVRQENLQGVLYFAPDPDRNQLRFRTRAGVSLATDTHLFKLLLANEHRRQLHPDGVDFDWDELIIDQLFWQWKNGDARVTLGRQNIIWDEGFLMLEGKPLDGSRSIFHDAARVQGKVGTLGVDLAYIRNLKRDQMVLAGDMDRALRDADETGVALRVEAPWLVTKFIFKREHDPDTGRNLPDHYTLAVRKTAGSKDATWWVGELAGQMKRYRYSGSWDLDVALHTRVEFPLGHSTRGHLGALHYGNGFRTPWGRWPLWSELYIYSLIGEGSPNREVHVAAWEDISGPFLGATHRFSETIKGKARLYYLMAPGPGWDSRGWLWQSRLDVDLHRNVKGHLVWEMFEPGEYPDRAHAKPETAHFLRWEVIVSL